MRARQLIGFGLLGLVAFVVRERRHPQALPYALRAFIEAPHPFITRERLRTILEPRVGERVLEVGCGTGYYSLEVASWIGPSGRLDILDVQQAMLDHTLRAAAERGLSNLAPTLADARSLPFADRSFDAALLLGVLGEIPDQRAALRELRRVLKPDGRLIVGETVLDPHFTRFPSLRQHATSTDLGFQARAGSPIGYFARFAPA